MTAGGTLVRITSAVEGDLDAAVVERLIAEAGGSPGPVYGRSGRTNLLANLDGYNRAAQFAPWMVLVDLDADDCAPGLVSDRLPEPSQFMEFRVAVREVEAWLLADRDRIARFLGVSAGAIPIDPDALLEPKEKLVEIASRSSKRSIKEELLPRPGSGRPTGSLYNPRLIEFVRNGATGWRPAVARGQSPSLERAISRLQELVDRFP